MTEHMRLAALRRSHVTCISGPFAVISYQVTTLGRSFTSRSGVLIALGFDDGNTSTR